MKKVALVLGGVSLGLLAAACSGGDEPAPFAEAPPTLVDALQERTGARWIADADPLTGRPYLYVALDDGRPVLSSGSAPSEVPGFVAALGRGLDLDDSFVDSLDAPEELTAASADTNATFRFTQHVPGTKIPVLSGGLVVGARDNGSLAFLQPTIVKGLRALDVNPTLSVEDTNRIIAKLAGHTPAADTAPPTLGVVALDPEHPKLVYRAFVTSDDGTPARVDIDAKTGAIIEIRTEAAAAMAYAAAADYPERDPRRKPDALAPVEVAIGNSNADTEGSAEDVPMRMIASSKTARIAIYDAAGIPFDEDHIDRSFPTQKNTTIAKCRFDSGGKNLHCDETGTNSYSAVDVQNNLVAAANWYWELGGRQWPRAAKEIPIFNHWGKGGEAFYHYGTNSIYIGDPKRVSTSNDAAPLVAYSAGTALDFMAHEYGHGIISRVTGTNGTHLDFENEAGALNEGLADVFAANAKASTGKSYGKATTFTFAEEVRPDHKAIRNFLHPTLGTEAGIAHFSQFKKLAANVAPVKKNDYGFVHANSTVVSQAWALMAWGGFNDVAPHLGVTAEVGFDRALRLFWTRYRRSPRPTTPSRGSPTR